VIDVSADGVANCNGKETTDVVRDELVAYGAVINGLPIIEHAPTANAPPVLPDTSRVAFKEAMPHSLRLIGSGLDP
jgi:hypothetical protein